MIRQRGTAVFVGVAFGLTLTMGPIPAKADVTVERYMRTGGFAGLGAGESTSVEKLSGLKKRETSNMKMTGFIGKMAGDMGSDTITDIQKDVVWRIDHRKKSYTESKITPPPTGKEQAGDREEKREKSTVRVIRNEISVKETGEKKAIGGYECTHYVVTWVIETEDTETRERAESSMVSDLWNTPETSEIKALEKEEREYTEAWLKKIGWDISNQEAQNLGLAMVAGMLGGDEASLKKGAKETAEKMAKIKGYPIASGVKWNVKSSGGGAKGAKKGEAASSEPPPDMPKGLSNLMAAMGKKASGQKDASRGASGSGGSDGAVFESYMEIRKISTAGVPGGEFAVPAGYAKTAR